MSVAKEFGRFGKNSKVCHDSIKSYTRWVDNQGEIY